MQGKLVTIFGGSGFLGRYVVQALAKKGARIRIAVRCPDKAESLRPLGNVGQVMPVYANTGDPLTVGAACIDADYVINLTGILFETRRQNFEKVHIKGASAISDAVRRHNVKRLIHVSAIGANADSDSHYAATKGKGEQAIKAHFDAATILRPSVMFGDDDKFINRFAELAALCSALPAFGGGKNKMQPVYVVDVAKAIVKCLEDSSTKGKTYELGGPKAYAFREIMGFILKQTGRKERIINLPYWLGSAMGSMIQLVMPSILTADQVKLLEKDNVVGPKALSFKELGLLPQSLEAIAPSYLERYRPTV